MCGLLSSNHNSYLWYADNYLNRISSDWKDPSEIFEKTSWKGFENKHYLKVWKKEEKFSARELHKQLQTKGQT